MNICYLFAILFDEWLVLVKLRVFLDFKHAATNL